MFEENELLHEGRVKISRIAALEPPGRLMVLVLTAFTYGTVMIKRAEQRAWRRLQATVRVFFLVWGGYGKWNVNFLLIYVDLISLIIVKIVQ